jgi:V/A-type H+/Na+-transporting ATPase subunit I
MLKPEKMGKILIAAPKDVMGVVVAELHHQRLFHVEDFVEDRDEEYEGYRIGLPLEGASQTSKDLIRLRSVMSAFSLKPEELKPKETARASALKEQIEKDLPALEAEVEALVNRRQALENQAKETEQKIEALSHFAEVPLDLSLLSGYQTVSVLAGYVSKKPVLGVPCEEYFAPSKKGNFFIGVVPKAYRSEAERNLLEVQFQAIAVPSETGTAKERLGEYSAKMEGVNREIQEVSAALDSRKGDYAGFLAACEELLSIDIEKAETPLRFATTEHAFITEGWVPRDEVGAVSEGISRVTGGKAFVTELPVETKKDVVPVEYDNISFARPSQLLMDTYARPRYTELDPTLIVAIIFPIFFGLILGDLGYGLILLVMSIGLWKFLKGTEGEAQQLIGVLFIASISTIICGVLYSEVFGFPIPGIEPILPSRHLNIGGHAGGHGPAIPELMIMVIWVGVATITLGRILGIVNHALHDHGSHRIKAVLANLGWIMVLWGLLVLIWSFVALPLMPDLTGMPPIVLGLSLPALLGLVMMLLGIIFIIRESTLEIIELPTILSHVLSFARIVGIGLSSVAIAMVVNFIAIGLIIEPQLEHLTIFGVVLVIIGALVFMIGHLLNTILGVLGAGIQSLRLNYIEFFTKFYKGGGKKYNPFGTKRRFTEE